ncbi:MAG: ATP-binding protein [Patescibacteria group bacterium]|nr:ATP-binding protein [Patescibacteria group bacterium]
MVATTLQAVCSSQWTTDIIAAIRGYDKHLLVVSGNIYDLVLFGEHRLNTLEEFIESLSSRVFDFYLQYNISTGPKLSRGDADEFLNLLGVSQDGMSEEDIEIATSAGIGFEIPRDPSELFPRLTKFFERSDKRTLFVMQYADSLLGCDTGVSSVNEKALNVAVKEWARSRQIQENGHVILILTKHAEDLDTSILDRDVGTYQLRIPKPDLEARRFFLESLNVDVGELEIVSKITAGLSLKAIESIVQNDDGRALTERVFVSKRQFLEEDYGDILKVMNPKWGFDCIGGLKRQVAELKRIAKKMNSGQYDKVPMGILFTGPPGTGKTVAGEALAKEMNVNMVSPGAIRSKGVGDTERFHRKFINGCIDMAPVIIWVDEVDNALGRRDDHDGSGGVERRIMQKNLEVMSDTSLRGKLLWIGATNVPQFMDVAMLRPGRFSLRMCFFPPNAEEREAICKAIINKYPEIKTNVKNWKKFAELTEGRNGADIESIIVEHAWIHADNAGRDEMISKDVEWAIDDFIPQEVRKGQINEMLLAGIRTCSSKSLLPDNWQKIMKSMTKQTKQGLPQECCGHSSDIPDLGYVLEDDIEKEKK